MREIKLPVTDNFAKAFKESVSLTFPDILGKSSARALLFRLQPMGFEDTIAFHKKLRQVLGAGSASLENRMIVQLARQMRVPLIELRAGDIVESATVAKRMLRRGRRG